MIRFEFKSHKLWTVNALLTHHTLKMKEKKNIQKKAFNMRQSYYVDKRIFHIRIYCVDVILQRLQTVTGTATGTRKWITAILLLETKKNSFSEMMYVGALVHKKERIVCARAHKSSSMLQIIDWNFNYLIQSIQKTQIDASYWIYSFIFFEWNMQTSFCSKSCWFSSICCCCCYLLPLCW